MSRPEPEIFESSGSRLSLYRDAPTWDGKPCAAIGELNFKSKRDGIQLINKAISQIDDVCRRLVSRQSHITILTMRHLRIRSL